MECRLERDAKKLHFGHGRDCCGIRLKPHRNVPLAYHVHAPLPAAATPLQANTPPHTSALRAVRTRVFLMSDANPPSRAQAVPKDLADAAAKDLEGCVEKERLEKPSFPWLYPPPGRIPTQRVTEAWFKVNLAYGWRPLN